MALQSEVGSLGAQLPHLYNTHMEKEHAEKEGLEACLTGATDNRTFLYIVECYKNLYIGVNL